MQSSELVKILRRMYYKGLDKGAENKRHGEASAMIHLFGIRYAAEIQACEESPARIAELATGKYRYGAEINKGLSLAHYVTVNEAGKALTG